MVAGLNPSRLPRASVRDPTGSPVAIKVSTIAVRISRSRSPIGGPGGIHSLVSHCASGATRSYLYPLLRYLDATLTPEDTKHLSRILGSESRPVKPGNSRA